MTAPNSSSPCRRSPRSPRGGPSTSARGWRRCTRSGSSGCVGIATRADRIPARPPTRRPARRRAAGRSKPRSADGRADVAVPALKDVPAGRCPEGFALAAICARDDPRDALVSNRYLDLAQLPGGARVGTVQPAARGAVARARSAARDPAAARRGRGPPAPARRGALRRDRRRRRGAEAAGLRGADRVGARSRGDAACAGSGRAGARMPRRSPRADRGAGAARRPRDHARHRRRSAPSRARCPATAARRSPRTRCAGTASCGCAGMLARARRRGNRCAASARRRWRTSPTRPRWASRWPTSCSRTPPTHRKATDRHEPRHHRHRAAAAVPLRAAEGRLPLPRLRAGEPTSRRCSPRDGARDPRPGAGRRHGDADRRCSTRCRSSRSSRCSASATTACRSTTAGSAASR